MRMTLHTDYALRMLIYVATRPEGVCTVNDVAAVAAAMRAVGGLTFVDAVHYGPHGPIDVQAIGCDFYAMTGHKLFGPTGTGALWARREHLQAMPPFFGGGEMIRTVSFDGTVFADPPYKFEAGTPNITGAVALGAAIDYLGGLDRDALAAHEDALLRQATAALGKIEGLRIIGTAAQKCSVVSFIVDGIHAHDIGTIVNEDGVAIRTGHHCAMPVMDFFGVAATARASLAFYNNEDDVDRLVRALGKAKGLFR